MSEAVNLARINWEWLSTVSRAEPAGHKWLKFGLFEWDDEKKSYQNIIWGDFLMKKDVVAKGGSKKK